MTRIVMTTGGCVRGRRVLERIHERGITLDAVLVLSGGFGPPRARRDESGLRRLLRWPRSAVSALRRKARFYRGQRTWYTLRCRRAIATGDMNSRVLRRDLERLAPDYLVLGGGGILLPHIIETAGVAVLNAHPALLPWMRGCAVVGYSLERGVAVGATVHLVDPGIDTGAVLARRLLPVLPGPMSLGALELAADELAAELMADVVEAIVRRGERPSGVLQDKRFPLFRWPPAAERLAHEALAQSGRAGELFEHWGALCTDTTTWPLPSNVSEGPPVHR
jgi:folate-dependent phosphoribosylglycinamide formyltransferase PurN